MGLLTPVPQKSLKLNELDVSLDKTLRLAVSDFSSLGIDGNMYGERNYEQTQRVGAAVNFLELDGLIAPSARWECDNLIIYGDNHSMDKKLEAIKSAELPFAEWSRYVDNEHLH